MRYGKKSEEKNSNGITCITRRTTREYLQNPRQVQQVIIK